MDRKKVAIMIDSCCDVPLEYVEKYNIYMIPLKVIYSDGEYLDKINITSSEVVDRFEKEIPKTSLPDGETIKTCYEKIISDGYENIIVVTISSGLSGTYNMMRLMAEEVSGVDIRIIDTKNIGIAAGVTAILAAELIPDVKDMDELENKLNSSIVNAKIHFCVDTLEYLRKGGRIGLVAGTIGQMLNLKPIISCNEDGVYYTVAKVRGRNKSLDKALEITQEYGNRYKKCNIAVAYAGKETLEEAKYVYDTLISSLPSVRLKLFVELTPALVVHTGPGLIGIAVQEDIMNEQF